MLAFVLLPNSAIYLSVVCDCGISFVNAWGQQAGHTGSATFPGLFCSDL